MDVASAGRVARRRDRYRLEVSMQLDEVQPPVLGVVLRNPIVPAKTRPDLHELNRRELIHQAPARLLAIRHRAVRIEKLMRDLQVVAAGNEPIGLEQGRELFTLFIGDAPIVGYLRLTQPGDGAGSESAEDPIGTLGAD